MPAFATPGPIAVSVQVAGARVRVTASDRAVNLNARVRQVCGQAGAGGQVDRDGDRAILVPGGGRFDR